MELSKFPQAIKEQALEIQRLSEIRDRFITEKKEEDIKIEKLVQGMDPKLCKNENQREIARFDFRTVQYNEILANIIEVESHLAAAKTELQYLRDEFSIAKLELQDQIITHY